MACTPVCAGAKVIRRHRLRFFPWVGPKATFMRGAAAIEPASTWAPLRNKAYRSFWLSSSASNLGGLIQVVGAGWLMVQLTPSPVMVALVASSNSLPMVVLSLLAGALADSLDRRRLMMIAQSFMALAALGLTLTVYLGTITPIMLLVFTFLIGCGKALFSPAWQASIGDIVSRQQVPAAVSLNAVSFNVMRSIGPAAGGAIVAAAGAAAAFLINTISFVPLIWSIWRWRPDTPPRRLPREPLVAALGAGFRYLSMSPALGRVMLRGALFGLGASTALALMPLVARDLLEGTALTYGLLLGFFGAGALLAGLVGVPLRQRLGSEKVTRLAFAIFALGLAGIAASRSLVFTGPAMMLCGCAWVMALALFSINVQLSTARWVVGRALSLHNTATFSGIALGGWIWGMVAASEGVAAAHAIAAALMIVTTAASRWIAIGEPATLDLDPLGRFREPELRLGLRPSSGPIMVMVDYRIAPEDTDAFLAVMQHRRRIRIRDGARQWALLRDLEDPETWTESYHVPTWVEYVRHNERRTKSDAEVTEKLYALHRGPERPRVHRMIERQTVPRHEDLPLKSQPELH